MLVFDEGGVAGVATVDALGADKRCAVSRALRRKPVKGLFEPIAPGLMAATMPLPQWLALVPASC